MKIVVGNNWIGCDFDLLKRIAFYWETESWLKSPAFFFSCLISSHTPHRKKSLSRLEIGVKF